jgi:hypothetical protein
MTFHACLLPKKSVNKQREPINMLIDAMSN